MCPRKRDSDFLSSEERQLVEVMLGLPHKIIKHQHIDGLAHLVMHEIAKPDGFGLKKAVYLVDNPDFDCLKGIAGYASEDFVDVGDVWANPSNFLDTLSNRTFNSKVRGFEGRSLRRNNPETDCCKLVGDVCSLFKIAEPSVISWDMKYDNHGLFVFEPPENACIWRKSLLASVVAFLSLCAI